MAETTKMVHADYRKHRASLIERTHFHEVLAPLVYHSLKASLLEYQNRDEAEDLQEL
jgi:hypothetical protein